MAERKENLERIILGSSSKWRKEILTEMGFDFLSVFPDIDEKAIRDKDPKVLTMKVQH
jgi:septum formation protein